MLAILLTAEATKLPTSFRLKDHGFTPASLEARANLDSVASEFANKLKDFNLNVITAESLTAGMIISYLVDVPFRGKYIYGGHAVYDSDAKRMFLGVREPNVYNEASARQMARGAIDSSRALVGIAVTGEAGPVAKDSMADLGVVDFAISLRTKKPSKDWPDAHGDSGRYRTLHYRLDFCHGDRDGHDYTTKWCQQYFAEAANNTKGWVNVDTLRTTRLAIRQETTFAALKLGSWFLGEVCRDGCPTLAKLPLKDYDGSYLQCGEPSPIVSSELPKTFERPETTSSHCALDSMEYQKPGTCRRRKKRTWRSYFSGVKEKANDIYEGVKKRVNSAIFGG